MGQTKRLLEDDQTIVSESQPTTTVWHTESLWQSERIDKLLPALLAFHKDGVTIRKDRTVPVGGGRNRSYTTLDEIISKVKPALAAHGLLVHQHLAGPEVVTMLHHVSGQFMASKVGFTPMNGTNVNSLQAAGGGLTYLKRYTLSALLFQNADEDTDGEGANESTVLPTIPDTKLPEIKKWLANGGTMAQVRGKYQLTTLQLKFLQED
jgi:hypothetical protein